MSSQSLNTSEQPMTAAEGAGIGSAPEVPLAQLIYGGTFGVTALIIAESGLFSYDGYVSIAFLSTCCLLLLFRTWLVGFVIFFVFLDWDKTEYARGLTNSTAWWYAFLMLILVISACRYLTLTAPFFSEDRGIFQSVLNFFRPPKPSHPVFDARAVKLVSVYEFVTGYARIAVACIAAALLFAWIPVDPNNAPISLGRVKIPIRAFEIVLTLFFAIVLINAILSILGWRRINTLQSRVYLNSVLSRWCFAEQRQIAKRIVKRRRK